MSKYYGTMQAMRGAPNVVPNTDYTVWANKYLAGAYRVDNHDLYVSRGTGYWGPPLRLFAPSEITEIILQPSKK